MPIAAAGIGAILIFMLFLTGKTVGLLSIPLVAGAGVATKQVGYVFAWVGILLTCATNIKYGTSLTASDLFLLPAFLLAIGWLLTRPTAQRPKVPAAVLLFGVALLVVTGFERMFNGISTLTAVYALRLTVIIIAVPVIFMVHGRTTRRFEGLIGAYVLSSAINGLLAGLDFFGLHYASSVTGNTGFMHSDRYAGLSTHTTQLGMISVLAVPFLVYLGRQNRLWFLAAPLTLLGVLASGSRGALVGVPVGLMALAICERKYRMRTIVSMVTLGIVAYVVAVQLGLAVGINRLTGAQSTTVSNAGRVAHLSTSIQQIGQRPLFGVGFGIPYSTNDYLAVLRAAGLIMGLPFIALWIWSFFVAQRVRTPLAFACSASVLSWLVLNLQFNGLYERYIWIPFAAAVGIARLYESGTIQRGDAEEAAAADPGSKADSPEEISPKPTTVRSPGRSPSLSRA